MRHNKEGARCLSSFSPDGIINTFAGGRNWMLYDEDGIPAREASFYGPTGVAVGPDGSVYIADTGRNRVGKVDPNGVFTTFAGRNTLNTGYSGDGGKANEARLEHPHSIAVANEGTGHPQPVDTPVK